MTETIEHLTDCVAFGTPQQKAVAAARLLSGSYLLMLEERTDRLALAQAILAELMCLCGSLPDTSFMDEYRTKSAILGQTVTVLDPGGTYEAVAAAIDELGGLVIAKRDGSIHTLRAGEISIKPKEQ